MTSEKIEKRIAKLLSEARGTGRLKGPEDVISGVIRANGGKGPRYLIEGEGPREFIKMDSNSYLGLSLDEDVVRAGEEASALFGAGPGSVRFIHGTYKPHRELEKKLASFHGREDAVIFSSAYAAVCGTVSALLSGETAVLSDELNHNSIINAVRMSRPGRREIYRHLDMDDLRLKLDACAGGCREALIVTDGVFSMRGDYPDLEKLAGIAREYGEKFVGGAIVVMDDSHGTGAFGETGGGTEEVAGGRADIIISTLGKALGVNGGYAACSSKIAEFLRETSPFYIYSNPITPGEAGSAVKALEILDSGAGRKLLGRLREMTGYFRAGLIKAGYEVLEGSHPITAVMVRDGGKTAALVAYLRGRGVLAVGIKYPVVPRGDECVRMQVNASHTRDDIDSVLDAMSGFRE